MVTFLVIAVVSGSLVLGAVWGIYGSLPDRVEGLIVALAGGALMISTVLELIEPASIVAPFWAVSTLVMAGAVTFAAADHLIKQRWGGDRGGGLLAAITLDGIPENLALGVALISTGPLGAAALSGSILLSNLPEAAGGAREMSAGGAPSPPCWGCGRRPPHCSPQRRWQATSCSEAPPTPPSGSSAASPAAPWSAHWRSRSSPRPSRRAATPPVSPLHWAWSLLCSSTGWDDERPKRRLAHATRGPRGQARVAGVSMSRTHLRSARALTIAHLAS